MKLTYVNLVVMARWGISRRREDCRLHCRRTVKSEIGGCVLQGLE